MADWWRNEFYSQFGEDAIVFSYFRVKEHARSGKMDQMEPGYYVDIGAHHPYMISNTWFFYQRGWHGVCVDPTPGIIASFGEHRPRDIALEIAISGQDGEASFFIHNASGVTNSLDPDDAPANAEKITVPTMRLATLLDRYTQEGQAIDILNVDVEGLDMEVLTSNDWTRHRPEIVIAERHGTSIHDLASSEIVAAMDRWGYDVMAWVQPGVIFRRR